MQTAKNCQYNVFLYRKWKYYYTLRVKAGTRTIGYGCVYESGCMNKIQNVIVM